MQNISASAILNIGTSVSNTVNEVTLATRFIKCELAGLVYVLKNFINLEVLIFNVVEDVEIRVKAAVFYYTSLILAAF